jgi:hypothetical protein
MFISKAEKDDLFYRIQVLENEVLALIIAKSVKPKKPSRTEEQKAKQRAYMINWHIQRKAEKELAEKESAAA